MIIGTILCLIGVALGLFLAIGSVISIANMRVFWAPYLLIASFLVPFFFIVGGMTPWILLAFGHETYTVYFMTFPWIFGALFVFSMLLTFFFG
jgi:hypothetical protein